MFRVTMLNPEQSVLCSVHTHRRAAQFMWRSRDRSLVACRAALEGHHAKGQVCLKLTLRCISGADLDFLSRSSKSAARLSLVSASFQPRFSPRPSSNYVSPPASIWQSCVSLCLPGCQLPLVCPIGGGGGGGNWCGGGGLNGGAKHDRTIRRRRRSETVVDHESALCKGNR